MSLQTDARASLLQAIRDRNNVDVPPEDMATTKPSDKEVGAQDAGAWLVTLQVAANHLRQAGWQPKSPTWDRAKDLLNKPLVESQIYLQSLVGGTKKAIIKALLVGSAATAIALGIHAARRSRR